ncbi:MAG: YgiT-type zinc finger protein [Halanaerobiales bacterium]|nr:YgiT-type zinc finger protein [Halanaerobiales bacterium]
MKHVKCSICGGEAEEVLRDFRYVYNGVPIILNEIPYLVCKECGEELIDSRYERVIEESINQYRSQKTLNIMIP